MFIGALYVFVREHYLFAKTILQPNVSRNPIEECLQAEEEGKFVYSVQSEDAPVAEAAFQDAVEAEAPLTQQSPPVLQSSPPESQQQHKEPPSEQQQVASAQPEKSLTVSC